MLKLGPSRPQQEHRSLRGGRESKCRCCIRSWLRCKVLVAAMLGMVFQHVLLPILVAPESGSFLPRLEEMRKKGKDNVVAYAITLTNCSQSPLQQQYLVDAAAVLKHSIHLTSSQTPDSNSRYNYQMYAFVHEDVASICGPVVPALQRLGYKVQFQSTPFSLDQIRNPILKEKIHKQGCCEEKEFLKLYTLQLFPHAVAVHLDLDTLVLRRLDHLYDTLLNVPSTEQARQLVQQHIQPHNAENEVSPLPNTIQSFFTRDYNMAIPGTQPTRVGMQGGFWIVRPNQTIFEDIVSMIVNHGNHYGTNCGWGGCKIGSARFYGGAGFQGVLSYYYTYFLSGDYQNGGPPKVDAVPEPQFVELNRCLYNSMADTARKACTDPKRKAVAACNHCNDTDFRELYGAHFTLCQKPWLCGPHHEQQLCYRFHHAWHAIRQDFMRQQAGNATTSLLELDDPVPDNGPRKHYAGRIVTKFPYQCAKKGPKGYVPMNLLGVAEPG